MSAERRREHEVLQYMAGPKAPDSFYVEYADRLVDISPSQGVSSSMLSEFFREGNFDTFQRLVERFVDKESRFQPVFTPDDFSSMDKTKSAYFQTDRYFSTRKLIKNMHRDGFPEHAKDRLAGKIFQDLAYYYSQEVLFPDSLVLSDDATFVIYHELFPKRKVTHFLNGDALRRLSVPDGVVVDLDDDGSYRVSAVLEYTARRHLKPDSFDKKREGFHKFNKSLKARDMEPIPSLHFVMLSEGYANAEEYARNVDVDFHEYPLHSDEFSRFVSGLISDETSLRLQTQNSQTELENGRERIFDNTKLSEVLARVLGHGEQIEVA
jgi:hypothetical protein